MQYLMDCPCGESVTVSESAAGSTVACPCGRTLAVPSLRELRSRAGLPDALPPPEMAVEALLLAGKLPEEDRCVLCGAATEQSVCCAVECERARVDSGAPSAVTRLVGFLTFGWLGLLVAEAARTEPRESGKDRIYRLPLRVCDACRPRLTGAAEARAALRRVRLYRRLLDKYPEAVVAPPC